MHQKNNFIGFLFPDFTLEIILLIFLIPGLFFLPGLILFFLLYIVFIAGLDGASQPAVEGVVGNVLYRYAQYALYTAVILSIAQIFIFPWSLFCNYLLKKAK